MNTNKLAYLIYLTVASDIPNKIKASTQKKIQDVLDSNINLLPPSLNQKQMPRKRGTALHLRNQGYSLREIMKLMGYKSPKSVQDLLNHKA